jgi:hypothetical protein
VLECGQEPDLNALTVWGFLYIRIIVTDYLILFHAEKIPPQQQIALVFGQISYPLYLK